MSADLSNLKAQGQNKLSCIGHELEEALDQTAWRMSEQIKRLDYGKYVKQTCLVKKH